MANNLFNTGLKGHSTYDLISQKIIHHVSAEGAKKSMADVKPLENINWSDVHMHATKHLLKGTVELRAQGPSNASNNEAVAGIRITMQHCPDGELLPVFNLPYELVSSLLAALVEAGIRGPVGEHYLQASKGDVVIHHTALVELEKAAKGAGSDTKEIAAMREHLDFAQAMAYKMAGIPPMVTLDNPKPMSE